MKLCDRMHKAVDGTKEFVSPAKQYGEAQASSVFLHMYALKVYFYAASLLYRKSLP